MIEQKGCQYRPHVLALQTNQKLDVVNDDATTHNIHPTPNNNREWNMSQPHGVPVEQTFARGRRSLFRSSAMCIRGCGAILQCSNIHILL